MLVILNIVLKIVYSNMNFTPRCMSSNSRITVVSNYNSYSI